MSCSVAVSNSPVFSPPPSLFCNKTSMITSTSETLNLAHLQQQPSQQSSSSPKSAPSSPSSPFRLRIPKYLSTLSSVVPGPSSPVTQLKRKRPAKLCIPIVSTVFPAAPTTPSTAAWRELVEEDREGYYSVYCKKGRREALEDRYSATLNLQGDPKQAFFGVFDGHGGSKAAEFAAQNLGKNILEEVVKRDDEDKIEESVRHGYLNTDSGFLKEDFGGGGSCCVTALIRNGNLFVSNAGDCRAVLSRGGTAEALTSDHRPSRDDERARIENLGGYVDMCHGTWRIQGSLAVSRGIGDRHFKTFVTAEPESQVLGLKPEHEFIILASDGLWDKVSNQEAVDIVRPSCLGIEQQQPPLACKRLAELSVSRGSRDDISVMVVQLGRYI